MTVPANPRFYIVGRNGCKKELIDHKRKSIQIESHDATLPQPKTNSFDFPSWTTLQKYSNYRRLQEKKKKKERKLDKPIHSPFSNRKPIFSNLCLPSTIFHRILHLRRDELSKKSHLPNERKKKKKEEEERKGKRRNWSQKGIHKSRSHLTFDQPPFPTETDFFFFNRQPYPQLSLLDYTFKARSEEACGTHLCRVRVLPTSLPVKQWASAEDREGVTRRVSWSIGPRLRPPYHPLLTQSRELTTTTTTGKKRTSPYMLPGPRCLYRVTLFDSHQTRSTCWPNRRRNVGPLIGKRVCMRL